MKIRILFWFWVASIYSINLDHAWNEARKVCNELNRELHKERIKYDKLYIAEGWRKCQKDFENLILGPSQKNFLLHPIITMTMLVQGYGRFQKFQSNYIQYFLSYPHRKLIKDFKDSNIGGVKLNIPDLNCSASALSHLYVLSMILEQSKDTNLESILEWGGGYGCLARIVKSLLPNITYIIVDLIPSLSLQYLYLKLCLPGIKILVHKTLPATFERGAIHLVPVYFVDKLKVNIDVFISAFALSECPNIIQKKVVNKEFYRSKYIYLCGLVGGLFDYNGKNVKYLSDSLIINYLTNNFNSLFVHPHQIIEGNHFEIIGQRY